MRYLIVFVLIGFGVVNAQSVYHFPVTQPAELKAYAGNDTSIQLGHSVSLGFQPSAVGGYGNYSYVWQPASFLDDPFTANPQASPIVTTTYTLSVTDDEDCSATAMVTVTVDTSTSMLFPELNKSMLLQDGRWITISNAGQCRIDVMHISGVKEMPIIVPSGSGDLRFCIEGASGMYIITLTGKNRSIPFKCVVL